MSYFKNELKATPFSEEDVCIVSKADPCIIYTGTKILYSGNPSGGLAASGYNYGSNESDVEPISCSGWGKIRIPEVNQLHKLFVFPRTPCIEATVDYLTLDNQNAPGTSGKPSGVGGCSGKVALVHYKDESHASGYISPACGTSGIAMFWCSGLGMYSSGVAGFGASGRTGCFNSGLIDYIAFASQY